MPTTINLENVLLRGLRSAQPAAGATVEGTLYFVTDEGVTEQVRSSAWVTYSNTTTLPLSSGQVTSGNIASGQVGSFHLSSGCIISGRIASGVVGTNHIANGGVLSGNIASGQVGRFHLSSGAIVSGTIASGQIGANHMASGVLAAGGFTAATQAQEEAGTDITVGTTPGRQQYHPSAAKAWVNFNGTGTVAIRSDYNVDTITDHGTGDYTINWDVDFADANYCAVGTCRQSAAGSNASATCENADNAVHSVSALRIYTFTTTNSATVDTPVICWAAFGDQ